MQVRRYHAVDVDSASLSMTPRPRAPQLVAVPRRRPSPGSSSCRNDLSLLSTFPVPPWPSPALRPKTFLHPDLDVAERAGSMVKGCTPYAEVSPLGRLGRSSAGSVLRKQRSWIDAHETPSTPSDPTTSAHSLATAPRCCRCRYAEHGHLPSGAPRRSRDHRVTSSWSIFISFGRMWERVPPY